MRQAIVQELRADLRIRSLYDEETKTFKKPELVVAVRFGNEEFILSEELAGKLCQRLTAILARAKK